MTLITQENEHDRLATRLSIILSRLFQGEKLHIGTLARQASFVHHLARPLIGFGKLLRDAPDGRSHKHPIEPHPIAHYRPLFHFTGTHHAHRRTRPAHRRQRQGHPPL